jgi:hypothetical protein
MISSDDQKKLDNAEFIFNHYELVIITSDKGYFSFADEGML